MSGVSNTQTSSLATNVGPISFSGISSGIDWQAVIQKETALSLAPITQYNKQITTLTQKNSELIKVNGLMASVQNALVALSDPSQYQAFSGTSSNPAAATAASTPGVAANPGTYTITSDTLATATQVTSAPAGTVGKKVTSTVAIANDNFQITPIAGSNGQGKITVDGVSLTYSPTDSVNGNLNSILANLTTAVDAVDPGFTASYNGATDQVTFKSTDQPISVGSPTDTGNLMTVLKLDIASVANSSTSGLIQSAGPISGLNEIETLNQNNANLNTAVTPGTFSINGVSFSVDPTVDSVSDVLKRINASSAGVVAAYNSVTGQITVTNLQTGPRSVVFGSPSDTSNFLSAVGLPDHSGLHGATTQVGQQASVTLQNSAGGTTTYYSGSNQVTNAIQGITLNLLSPTSTPFTISVAQDSSTLVSNIQNFASAYNAALNELNSALAPPVVQQNTAANSKSLTNSSTTLVNGGPLFGDLAVSNLRDRLITLAQTIVPSAGLNFSLSSIGLQLSDTFSVVQATQAGAQTSATSGTVVSGALTTQTMQGTDGTFQPFNLGVFQQTFASNPNGVQNLFLNASTGLLTQFGSYLTGVTGAPTLLNSGPVGTIPVTALIQADENQNSDTITSVQQFIKQLQDSATQQANLLQSQANKAETAIAGYQATQAQITQLQNSGQL